MSETSVVRSASILIAIAGLAASGCLTVQPPPPPTQPASMSAWGPMGGFAVNYGNGTCSGLVSLTNGFATVADPCFTANNNAVVCSDNSSPNAVKCTPVPGSLLVQGTGSDAISYARVK